VATSCAGTSPRSRPESSPSASLRIVESAPARPHRGRSRLPRVRRACPRGRRSARGAPQGPSARTASARAPCARPTRRAGCAGRPPWRGPTGRSGRALCRRIVGELEAPEIIRLNCSGEPTHHPHIVEAIGLAAATGVGRSVSRQHEDAEREGERGRLDGQRAAVASRKAAWQRGMHRPGFGLAASIRRLR